MAAFDLPPVPRDLGTVAKAHARLPIDKHDPYRMRYGEILGKPLQRIDRGFLDYAIRDAVATYEAMAQLYQKAVTTRPPA